MARRLSEWDRLNRATEVALRALTEAETDVEKLERQIARIDAGEFSAADRAHFARQHSSAQVRVIRSREKYEAAQTAQADYEATRARFRPEEPPPQDHEVLSGEQVTNTVAEIKRQAGLQRPA